MSEWSNRLIGYGLVDADQLLANPANWRRHPNVQREALRGSLDDLGWIAPVIVNQTTGFMIDGHARAEEALARGGQVPVAYVELTPAEEAEALAILDPIGAMATADADALDALLREVSSGSEAIQALLADIAKGAGLYLDQPLAEDPGADLDHADELREKWGTEAGQLWELGKHRLLCGDATSEPDVGRLLAGVVPLLMVTDPPYGVEYDPTWRARAGVNLNRGKLGEVSNDAQADWREAWALFPGAVAYVWHAGRFASTVQESIEAAGFEIRSQIIWAKDRFALSRGHYHWQHEPCWYAVRRGDKGHWCGDRSQSTLWSIPAREDAGHGHATQKPVECMRRPIENNSSPGQAVFDPFLGSGTTLVAAEQADRVCYGLELEPKYVAVTLERMQGMGLEPRLLDD